MNDNSDGFYQRANLTKNDDNDNEKCLCVDRRLMIIRWWLIIILLNDKFVDKGIDD